MQSSKQFQGVWDMIKVNYYPGPSDYAYEDETDISSNGGGGSGVGSKNESNSDRTGTNESDNGAKGEKDSKNIKGKNIWDVFSNIFKSIGKLFGLVSSEKIPDITIDVENVRWGVLKDEKDFGKDKIESSHNSSIVSTITYTIPIWGNCQRASDYLWRYDFVGTGVYFGFALLDGFSLGYSSSLLTSTVKLEQFSRNLFFNSFTGVESNFFGKGSGLLNRNDYIRVGWSWNGTKKNGYYQFRIGILHKKYHIDIFNYPYFKRMH